MHLHEEAADDRRDDRDRTEHQRINHAGVAALHQECAEYESSYGRAFPRFYLRGYGNTDFRLNASQPVSLVYDDVVQENPILKGFPVFDVGRIEVLRGPQGSLFGRNTPAGVVKFDSVRPSLRRNEGYASLSAGTFQTVNAEAAMNLPIPPSINVSLPQ